MQTTTAYQQYREKMQEIADIRSATALLQWDQETYMPPGSADARARQVAVLSEMSHRLFTSEELGSLLQELNSAEGLSEPEQINVRLSWEDYQKQKKYSSSFVRRLSETCSRAFGHWQEARKKNDFAIFEKDLAQLVTLKLEEADLLGYTNHPYDALLGEHDKGSTVQQLDVIFNTIEQPLHDLLERIMRKPAPDDDFLRRHYAKDKQWNFGLDLLKEMGFKFDTGRQDLSTHPFTISFGNTDVRVTTRVDENDFSNMTWSCLHEGGHALYEQNLPREAYGLPLGEAASFAVHESQSRLWENCVGRGMDYWKYHYPRLQAIFPEHLGHIQLASFYRAINKVAPSLIRTEADELTYHFHIMIRYRLEKQLLSKELQPADIPAAWSEAYYKSMGIRPSGYSDGCLQDVHWSHGSFGYFPTYSTGSMMGVQLWDQFCKEYPAISSEISAGNTEKLLNWLIKSVHNFGRRFMLNDLCTRVTGEMLNPAHLLQYLERKYSNIYQL